MSGRSNTVPLDVCRRIECPRGIPVCRWATCQWLPTRVVSYACCILQECLWILINSRKIYPLILINTCKKYQEVSVQGLRTWDMSLPDNRADQAATVWFALNYQQAVYIDDCTYRSAYAFTGVILFIFISKLLSCFSSSEVSV